MAEGEREQSREMRTALATWGLILALLVVLGAPSIVFLLGLAGPSNSGSAITDSAVPPVFLWCLGWPILFARRAAAGRINEVAEGLRVVWTLACLLCLLHIATAFHLAHGWSHEAAWEHTKQVSGYGDGIYVIYLFTLVWLADVIWAWVAFDSYLSRPRWLSWTIHGFLAFVVFNAVVVFGSNLARSITFLLAFLVSLGVTFVANGGHKPPEKTSDLQ